MSMWFNNYYKYTIFGMSYDLENIGLHPWSIILKKIIGSSEKNRVGQGTGTTGIFFGLMCILYICHFIIDLFKENFSWNNTKAKNNTACINLVCETTE